MQFFSDATIKDTELLSQTRIFESLYLCNPMSKTFDILNYEFC